MIVCEFAMLADVETARDMMTFCVFQSCETVPRGDMPAVNSMLK
jgi:hypothetical protein